MSAAPERWPWTRVTITIDAPAELAEQIGAAVHRAAVHEGESLTAGTEDTIRVSSSFAALIFREGE
jgi:hypothetical protein